MEINDYGDIRLGAVAQEDIVEGRIGLLTTNVHSRNYGSQTDLPGVKLPTTSTEAAQARYIIAFEQDNRSLPIYQPQPHYDWATRYGWEQATNAPFAATVYITHPGVQEGMTIPSGAGVVAFGEGIYTVPSGSYVYNANLEVPGAFLAVADTSTDTAADKGKLKYSATAAFAEVVHYDSATYRLTFRIIA